MNIKKETIIAQNKEHLQELIKKEIDLNGQESDLNFIDTSKVINMSYLFTESQFNGDISAWNTSNVQSMSSMFQYSKFNGDISKWDVSSVLTMRNMFSSSEFNSDISDWKTLNVIEFLYIFHNCMAPIPYWAKIENLKDRGQAIEAYHTQKILNQIIIHSNKNINTLKI